MILSKLLQYSAIGVGLIIFGEIYHECAIKIKDKLNMQDELDEIHEVFFTRKPKNDKSAIIRQITFRREPTLFITEILENLIKSSRKTIHLAMYIFTSMILADALKSANENGVKIYVIVDQSMESASGTQIQNLNKKGIAVKICYANTLHHKFCLIDVPYNNDTFLTYGIDSQVTKNDKPCQVNIPKNGILISGSLNWTREALTSNYENFVVSSNKKIMNEYFEEFVERWKSSRDL